MFTNAIEKSTIMKLVIALRSETGMLDSLHGLPIDAIKSMVNGFAMRKNETACIEKSLKPEAEKIHRVIQYIEDNYNEDISLEKLASISHLSVYHFSRVFKQVTGKSPHQYLISSRLQVSKKLLLNTSKSITCIAIETGYKNAASFTAAFKQSEGIPPTVYRKNFDS